MLKVYHPGESFGELALLYSSPRAATITTTTECVLLSLDRECFNNIVKSSAVKRRQKYLNFISKVKLFQTLDDYEKMKICDAVVQENYFKGDYIVRQGQSGQTMYFLMSGDLIATK